MRSHAKRPSVLANLIFLVAVSAATAVAQAAASPQAEYPAEPGPYLTAQRLVRVGDGRTINLICLGHGSPTVILNAGLGSWAIVWRSVQTPLARTTRVCAWDPAGFGFSSPSSEPQDAVHLTQDLEQTLKVADVAGPYLMVGHSAGAFVALRFADQHPKSVVGMVLIDPAIPEEDAIMKRVAPKFALRVDASRSAPGKSMRRCAAGFQNGGLKHGTPEFEECTSAPRMPAAFSVLKASLTRLNADPARLLTEASSLDNFRESQGEAVNPQRRYGDMPLIVLTAGRRDMPPDTPADERDQGMLF
jgi:pimeloyl-ACP methyl ester carboxylesterase